MKIAIITDSRDTIKDAGADDYTSWIFDIDSKDFQALTEKYQNGGCSVRGTKEDIIEDIKENL